MRISIPFTDITLKIDFGAASNNDGPSMRQLQTLDKLSSDAAIQMVSDGVRKLTTISPYDGDAHREQSDAILNVIEGKRFLSKDLNPLMENMGRWYKDIAYSDSIDRYDNERATLHLESFPKIFAALHQAGGEFSAKTIRNIIDASDANLGRGEDGVLKYIAGARILDSHDAQHYSNYAKSGVSKQLLSYAYGADVHQAPPIALAPGAQTLELITS